MPRSHIDSSNNSSHPAIVLATGPAASPDGPAVTELSSLLTDLGFSVVDTVCQRRGADRGAQLLGLGKLEELRAKVSEVTASVDRSPYVVVAREAHPGQLRYLERALDVSVLDRTEVILRVFETRARTRLANLEIELARLLHELPRVRDDHDRGDKEGGGGRGGRGHSNVELTKQRLKKRAAELKKEIAQQRAQRQRTAARRRGLPQVTLVGYTNAGKSAWMRALTKSSVLVEDKLFATLDTTVRSLVENPGRRILVADTVGFMSDLPHSLLESFRSTLEEALDAELLLHVADASNVRFREQIQTTERVLAEVSTGARRILLLLNKADRLSPEARSALAAEYPEARVVSSQVPDDVHEVSSFIRAFAEAERAFGADSPRQ